MKEMFVAAWAPVTKSDFGQKRGIWLKKEGQSSIWRWKRWAATSDRGTSRAGSSQPEGDRRNTWSCPPNLTSMPWISAWIPMCCEELGQAAAPHLVPDCWLLCETSPARRGSSKAAGTAQPSLRHLPSSSHFLGSLLVCWVWWHLAFMHHHRATCPATFLARRITFPSNLANCPCWASGKSRAHNFHNSFSRASTELLLPQSHRRNEGTELEKSGLLQAGVPPPKSRAGEPLCCQCFAPALLHGAAPCCQPRSAEPHLLLPCLLYGSGSQRGKHWLNLIQTLFLPWASQDTLIFKCDI